MEGLNFFSCLTGKYFNKCHKKAVFRKHNLLWVYNMSWVVVIFLCCHQPNSPPPTIIKWQLLIKQNVSMFILYFK